MSEIPQESWFDAHETVSKWTQISNKAHYLTQDEDSLSITTYT